MKLLTEDREEVARIAKSLQECGCCARCTLRYLGLKETYDFRRSLEEMKDEVQKLLDIPQDSITSTSDKNESGDTENDEQSKLDCDEKPVENDTEMDQKILIDNRTDALNLCKINTGARIHTKTDNKINDNIVDIKADNLESGMDSSGQSVHIVEKTVSKENTKSKQVTDKSDECKTEVSDSSVCLRKCGLSLSESDTENLDIVMPEVNKADTLETNTESVSARLDAVDTNGLPELKPNSSGDRQESFRDQKQQSPCIVCLGILEEFTSDEFLQKIKAASIGEGFEFTNYICSLMIPVSIILREHALMLFLKEKHGSVYENVNVLDIATVKDVWKWRNGPILRETLGAPFDQKSAFDIILNFIYKDSDKECSFLLGLMSDTFRKRKQDRRNNKKGAFQVYNRANVSKAILEMSAKEFRSHFQCPPAVPFKRCTCDIKCQNEAIFVAGRYNKYSRTLSQTPWIIEGQRRSESSVEELICTEIDRVFRPTEHKFSSAGREDVDVLMLGDGRPFIVELTNPKRVNVAQEEVTNIQKVANDATKDIQIRDLQIVSREETEKLKEGEIDKIKNYSALCWSKTPLSAEQLGKLSEIKDLKILQKTPIRVLHRRPLSTREKCIHCMTAERVDDYHFRLSLKTQAGTYIKEFVHGDFGRTKPSLTALLGVECDILELDVQSVELDWPKKLG